MPVNGTFIQMLRAHKWRGQVTSSLPIAPPLSRDQGAVLRVDHARV